MWSLKTRPKPGFSSFAVRSFSGVGLAEGWISNVKLISLFPIIPAQLPRRSASFGPAGSNGTELHDRLEPDPAPDGGEDMLLWRAEVQYGRRDAARQSQPIREPAVICPVSKDASPAKRTKRSNIS